MPYNVAQFVFMYNSTVVRRVLPSASWNKGTRVAAAHPTSVILELLCPKMSVLSAPLAWPPRACTDPRRQPAKDHPRPHYLDQAEPQKVCHSHPVG